MRIEARYFEGFTEHLLRWKLEVNNGKASLEADWFRVRPPCGRGSDSTKPRFVPFPLDLGMKEDYQLPWDDMDNRVLIVTDGETSIRHRVYGAGVLAKEHSEIGTFLWSGS